jgi:hypothetical protein
MRIFLILLAGVSPAGNAPQHTVYTNENGQQHIPNQNTLVNHSAWRLA